MSRQAGWRWVVVFLAIQVLSALIGCSGCRRSQEDDGTAPVSRELPKLELRDETPDLEITWIDSKGDHHVVQHVADVPVEGRDAVRVYLVNKDEGTGDLFYVADLRTKSADGTYPVQTMSRSEWDLVAEKRRSKTMAGLAPTSSGPGSSARSADPPSVAVPTSGLTVVVYGAEWCAACHEAKRHLRRKGIAVVEKDIEQDAGARREMQQKLSRAGIRDSGSIPVIDVRGRILTGFSARDLDKAIAEATRGEVL